MAMISTLSLLYLFCSPLSLASAFELVDKSPDSLMVAEGKTIALQCSADIEFDFCEWTHVDSGVKCRIAADENGIQQSCAGDDRISWNLEPTKCGIVINEANRDTDPGQYKCTLIVSDNEGVNTVSGSSQVDVATQPWVHFGEDFGNVAEDESVPVRAGEVSLVVCHAMGGYPDPEVQVALGEVDGIIDEENDVLLEETEGVAQKVENEDGTLDHVKVYTLMPTMSDCGKYVKCEAIQRDPEGNLLFDHGGSIATRRIMVQFGPQPLEEAIEAVFFSEGDESVQVDIEVKANPQPKNNQAIWHVSPTSDIRHEDALALEAGNMDLDKYLALPLNKSEDSHVVVASLVITDLKEVDASFTYVLHVITELGEMQYPFKLTTNWVEEKGLDPPEGKEDIEREEPKVKQGSISTGSIVAIVVVVVAVIIVVGLVFWAKANDKLCFKPADKKVDDTEKGASDEMLPKGDQEGDGNASQRNSKITESGQVD